MLGMSSLHQLDTRGLLCPIPVIHAQDAASRLPAGALVQLMATDPGVLYDIPAWCRIHGHQVLSCKTLSRMSADEEFHIEFKVGNEN